MGSLTIPIAAGADDGHAEYRSGGSTPYEFQASLEYLEINRNVAIEQRYAWLRFQNVTIPQGATITSAYLTVVPSSTFTGADAYTYVTVRCADADNCSAPADEPGAHSTFIVGATDGYGRWYPPNMSAGSSYNTYDFCDAVQEVVDREGWESGNSLGVSLFPTFNETEALYLAAYEHSSYDPVELHIEYTDGAPNPLKLYIRNDTPAYMPTTRRGAWDVSSATHVFAMGAGPLGDTNNQEVYTTTAADYDGMVYRASYVLRDDAYFSGAISGVIGAMEGSADANASLHVHVFATQGESDDLRGTIFEDHVDADELSTSESTCGEAFSGTMSNVACFAGDVIVVEAGFQASAGTSRAVDVYYGGWASALADGGDPTADAASWIQFAVAAPIAPSAPTLDAPVGSESWREGSTQDLEYTEASPEQSQGYACSYEFELSTAGTFADAAEITDGITGGSYSWTIPADTVSEDTDTCKIRVRAYVTGSPTVVSDWDTSDAFSIDNSTAPTTTLVDPEDDEQFQGGLDLMPTFIFGTADTESDPVHVEFIVSYSAEYSDPVIDTDSETDYADWEESESPYEEWTTMTSGGATAGNRIRYKPADQLRYDYCYAKVRLKDAYSTAEWTEFEFTIVVDPELKLSVTIGGVTFSTKDTTIAENTGGDVSPISFSVSLPAYLANEFGKGEAVAIASGLGDHNRTWNGTIELRRPNGSLVSVIAYQDDMYLEEKLCTGDKGSADLGANLAGMVASYGSPLTGTNIDTSTGVTQAIEGGYKSLRDKFDEAKDLLPDYIGPWVDAGGDIHFISQDDLPAPLYRLYEGVPSTHAIPKTIVRYSTGGDADEVVCANLPDGYYLQVTDSESATASAQESSGTATVDTSGLAASPYANVGVYDGDPDVDGELVEELTVTDYDDMADEDLYAYVTLIRLIPPVSPELSTIGVKNRVYVSVKDSSPLTVAYATNDATDPKYSESPREWWRPIESGDETLCGTVAAAQLAFRKLEREKLTGLQVNLTHGLGILRGTAVWVTIPTMGIDGMYPVRRLEHRFATGAHSTTVDVGDYEYVRDLDGAVLKLGKSLVRLEKESAI